MIDLQSRGCHNINLVTPSHFLPWILESVRYAAGRGLNVPLVYNCGGYETLQTLALTKNIVDIYLPDMKYGDNAPARLYSNAPDYVDVNRSAIREMFRQVGPLKCDIDSIAYRGLIIRHLVLPGGEAGSKEIRKFLLNHFDPHDIFMSVMAQYRPLYKAFEHESLARTLTTDEYVPVREAFVKDGFNGYYQELDRLDTSFVIDFQTRKTEELTGD
jgi:putative pyruvate formate lyase activating enzyme